MRREFTGTVVSMIDPILKWAKSFFDETIRLQGFVS
jgi:hypothetical protein